MYDGNFTAHDFLQDVNLDQNQAAAPQEQGYKIDQSQVTQAMRDFDAVNDTQERAEQLLTLHLLGKTKSKEDPRKVNSRPLIEAYFGLEDGDSKEIDFKDYLQKARASWQRDDEQEEKDFKAFNDKTPEQQWAEIGSDTQQIHTGGLTYGTGISYVPTEEEKKQRINEHKQYLFGKSKNLQLKSIAQDISKPALMFGRRTLATGKINRRSFAALPKEQQELALSYIGVANPELQEAFAAELGTRVVNTADRAYEGSKAGVNKLYRFATDPHNDVNMESFYESVKDDLGKDDISELFDEKGEFTEEGYQFLRKTQGRYLPYEIKYFDKYPTIEGGKYGGLSEHSLKRMTDLAGRLRAGQELYEDRKHERSFRNALYERYERGGTMRNVIMTGTEMGTELGIMALVGIGTGGAGVAGYSANRFFGDTYEKLTFDHGMRSDEAAGLSALMAIPYAAVEKIGGFIPLSNLDRKIKEKTVAAISSEFVKRFGKAELTEFSEEMIQEGVSIATDIVAREMGAEGILNENLKDQFVESVKQNIEGLVLPSAVGAGLSIKRDVSRFNLDSIDNVVNFEREEQRKKFIITKGELTEQEAAELAELSPEAREGYAKQHGIELDEEKREQIETLLESRQERNTQVKAVRLEQNTIEQEKSSELSEEQELDLKQRLTELNDAAEMQTETVLNPVLEAIAANGYIRADDMLRSEISYREGGIKYNQFLRKDGNVSWDQMLQILKEEGTVKDDYTFDDLLTDLERGRYIEQDTDYNDEFYQARALEQYMNEQGVDVGVHVDSDGFDWSSGKYYYDPTTDVFRLSPTNLKGGDVMTWGRSFKDYGKIIETGLNEYAIQGNNGVTVKVVVNSPEFADKPSNAQGFYSKSRNEIHLPQHFDNFVLSHELTHALVDLGVITRSEFNSLVQYAKDNSTADLALLEKQYRDEMARLNLPFSQYDLDHEILAKFAEQLDGLEVPKELQNPVKKILDFIQGLLAKVGILNTEALKQRKLARQLQSKEFLSRQEAEGKRQEGDRYSFAGEKANLPDDVRAKFEKAKTMLAEGKYADEIIEETGWFRGLDDMWRYEVDDSKAQARIGRMKTIREKVDLDHFLVHDELFEIYPHLRTVQIMMRNDGHGHTVFEGRSYIAVDYQTDPDTWLSVMMHEIQHAIQYHEGFSRGGSPSMFRPFESEAWLAHEAMLLRKVKPEDFEAEAERLEVEAESEVLAKDNSISDKQLEVLAKFRSPYEAYDNLAGEIEANEVMKRLNMNKDDRYFDEPRTSYGNSDAIVIFYGDDLDQYRLPDNDDRFSLAPPTDSAAFKNWFKDSKVVNEDGTPKVVYHGTSYAGFNTFDVYGSNYGLMGSGSYFTENASVAESYQEKGTGSNKETYAVYLAIQNPLDMDAQADLAKWRSIVDEYDVEVSEGMTNEQLFRELEEALAYEGISLHEGADIVSHAIESMGYDGVTHLGGGRWKKGGDIRHQVWIALNPNQIKSATENNGDYSLENDDIRFSLAQDQSAQRSLVVTLAKRLFDGDTLTRIEVENMAKAQGLEGKGSEVFSDAKRVAKEAEKNIFDYADDVRKITSAEIFVHHNKRIEELDEKIKEIYKSGRKGGEIYQQAAERVKKRKKQLAELQAKKLVSANDEVKDEFLSWYYEGDGTGVDKRPDQTIEETEIETIEGETEESESGDAREKIVEMEYKAEDAKVLVDKIERTVKENLIVGGVIEKSDKDYQSKAVYRAAFKQSLVETFRPLLSTVVYGKKRETLVRRLNKLASRGVYQTIHDDATYMFEEIGKARTKETRRDLVRQIVKVLKPFKREPVVSSENKERKADALVHQQLNYGYKVLQMGSEKVTTELDALKQKIYQYENYETLREQVIYEEAKMKYDILNTLGDVRYSHTSLSHVKEALATVKEMRDEGEKKVEQMRAEHEKKHERAHELFNKAISLAQKHIKLKPNENFLTSTLLDNMNVVEMVEDVGRYLPTAERKEFEKIFSKPLAKALRAKKELIAQKDKELRNKVNEIYGVDTGNASAAVGLDSVQKLAEELNRMNDAYARFSVDGRTSMSKAELMHIIATFYNDHYVKMATDTNEDGSPRNAKMAAQYENLEAMKDQLTDKEKAVAEAMADVLNTLTQPMYDATLERVGLKMKVNEDRYWRGFIEQREAGFQMLMSSVSMLPASIEPRVQHDKAIDSLSIFESFNKSIEDSVHYLTVYDAMSVFRATFGKDSMNKSLRSTFGDEYTNRLQERIAGAVNDAPLQKDRSNPVVDKLRAWVSYIGMWGSGKSMVGQLAGGTAFANKIGTKKFAQMIKETAHLKSTVTLAVDLLKSEYMQSRLRGGAANEAVQNAIRELEKGAGKGIMVWRKVLRAGMLVPSLGDVLTSSFFGAMYYQTRKADADLAGLSKEEAHSEIMDEIFELVEMTQQATSTAYQSGIAAYGGSATKGLAQFRSDQLQKLGHEMKELRGALADAKEGRKKEAMIRAAELLFYNHIINNVGFWVAQQMFLTMLGEEPDEDDLATLASMILLGPFGSWLMAGDFITTVADLTIAKLADTRNPYPKSVPMYRIYQDLERSFRKATKDDAELGDVLYETGKRMVRPVSHADKFYKNHMED